MWEERRATFYKSIPASHWKDGEKRKLWRLCTAESKFIQQEVQSADPQIQPAAKGAKAKAKAKASAKVKRAPAEPGREPGRGRGWAVCGKAACRP